MMEFEKLEKTPIPTLLVQMSVPMMFSFLIQALYNVVDSMFVSHISENVLTAVSLAYPMQALSSALAVGVAVGMSAVLPRRLSNHDLEGANEVNHVGLWLSVVFSLLFMFLAIVIVHPFYALQTDVLEIVSSGTTYLRICWMIAIGEFLGQYFEKLLIASGNSFKAMISKMSGAILNIILDYIFIFIFHWGVAGAAWATVLGQLFSALIAYILNRNVNHWMHIHLRNLHYDKAIVSEIFEVGIPSMVTIGLSSITTFCVNLVLLSYSTTATAIYGIWMKIQNFAFMPIYGLNNSMIPILSYNQEKALNERVKEAIRLALAIGGGLMLVFSGILELLPEWLLGLFNASDHMLRLGVPALRISFISLFFGGISIILASCLQAMHHGNKAFIIHILRQLILIVPMFIGLSILFQSLDVVWWATTITDILSFIVAIALFKKEDLL